MALEVSTGVEVEPQPSPDLALARVPPAGPSYNVLQQNVQDCLTGFANSAKTKKQLPRILGTACHQGCSCCLHPAHIHVAQASSQGNRMHEATHRVHLPSSVCFAPASHGRPSC